MCKGENMCVLMMGDILCIHISSRIYRRFSLSTVTLVISYVAVYDRELSGSFVRRWHKCNRMGTRQFVFDYGHKKSGTMHPKGCKININQHGSKRPITKYGVCVIISVQQTRKIQGHVCVQGWVYCIARVAVWESLGCCWKPVHTFRIARSPFVQTQSSVPQGDNKGCTHAHQIPLRTTLFSGLAIKCAQRAAHP